jgi:NifB/MoaA-like Fe-S oxidoreductase
MRKALANSTGLCRRSNFSRVNSLPQNDCEQARHQFRATSTLEDPI